jgi:hypothetical protein
LNRERIEALWSSNPKLTQRDVQRITGAPKMVVRFVYAQLVARGALQRPPQARDALALLP